MQAIDYQESAAPGYHINPDTGEERRHHLVQGENRRSAAQRVGRSCPRR